MKRLITETPNSIVQKCHNQVFIKDHETWLRFGGRDGEPINLYDFVREHMKEMEGYSNEEINNLMCDDYGDEYVPIIYCLAWSFAEVRERLKAYEDTRLMPDEVKELLTSHFKPKTDEKHLAKRIDVTPHPFSAGSEKCLCSVCKTRVHKEDNYCSECGSELEE